MALNSVSHTFFILMLAYFVCATTSQDLEAITSTAHLPTPRALTSAVYDGDDSIYIFGGYNYNESTIYWDIVRYTIYNDTTRIMARMPRAAHAGTVSRDADGNMYYIGGYRIDTITKGDLYRYSPHNGSVSILGYVLNNEFSEVVALNETSTLILGGYYYPASRIVHFDMTTHDTYHVANMSKSYYQLGAFTDGNGKAFIFGSSNSEPTYGNTSIEILNMNTFESSFGPANFPSMHTRKPAAVYNGNYAYIVGGFGNETLGIRGDGLIQLNLETMEHQFLPVKNFPAEGFQSLTGTSMVYVEKLHRIYLFGGRTGLSYGYHRYYDNIWWIDLPDNY